MTYFEFTDLAQAESMAQELTKRMGFKGITKNYSQVIQDKGKYYLLKPKKNICCLIEKKFTSEIVTGEDENGKFTYEHLSSLHIPEDMPEEEKEALLSKAVTITVQTDLHQEYDFVEVENVIFEIKEEGEV